MATINEIIKAYYLHRSQGMMNYLNNLHRKYSTKKSITRLMAVDLLEGEHQVKLRYNKRINYAKMVQMVCDQLRKSVVLTDPTITNFEQLYDAVNTLLSPVRGHGIGDLTVYDIALRIGYIRQNQILPKDKVYLFAGANVGANNLLGITPSLFDTSVFSPRIKIACDRYDLSLFKSPLCDMSSMFLEDMLCVYDSKLKNYTKKSYGAFQKVPNYVFSYK